MKDYKIHKVDLDGDEFNLGYKVVLPEMMPLGLRKNPSKIVYSINDWLYLPEEEVIPGVDDVGGIWVARTLGGARGLYRYMLKKHNCETRIFKTALDDILYVNDYRIKTNGVNLFEELFFEK